MLQDRRDKRRDRTNAVHRRGRKILEMLTALADRVATLSSDYSAGASCTIFAIVLTLGSIQPLLGVIVYGPDSQPAFTLNICHPLQSIDQQPSVLSLTPPTLSRSRLASIDFERISEFVTAPLAEFISDVDPPPPKPAA